MGFLEEISVLRSEMNPVRKLKRKPLALEVRLAHGLSDAKYDCEDCVYTRLGKDFGKILAKDFHWACLFIFCFDWRALFIRFIVTPV